MSDAAPPSRTPPWRQETLPSGMAWCPRCWSDLDYREFEPGEHHGQQMWPDVDDAALEGWCDEVSVWVTCYVHLVDDTEPCGEDIWIGRRIVSDDFGDPCYGPTYNDEAALLQAERRGGPA